jgi:hypothetical protein
MRTNADNSTWLLWCGCIVVEMLIQERGERAAELQFHEIQASSCTADRLVTRFNTASEMNAEFELSVVVRVSSRLGPGHMKF